MKLWKGWTFQHNAHLIALLIAGVSFVGTVTAAITAICGATIPLPDGETCAQCIRAWVGATSGWAAAIAAAATVLVLLSQKELLSKQTQYAAGDVPPDCYRMKAIWRGHLSNAQYNGGHKFAVVNHNRRKLVVSKIVFFDLPPDVQVMFGLSPLNRTSRENNTQVVQFLADSFRVSTSYAYSGNVNENSENFEVTVQYEDGTPFEGELTLRLYFHYGGDLHEEEARDYRTHFRFDGREYES